MKFLLFLALAFGFVGCKTLDAVKNAADKYGVSQDLDNKLKLRVVDVFFDQLEKNKVATSGVDGESKSLEELLLGEHKFFIYDSNSGWQSDCYLYANRGSGRLIDSISVLDDFSTCVDGGLGFDMAEIISGIKDIPKELTDKNNLIEYGKSLVFRVLSFYLVGGVAPI